MVTLLVVTFLFSTTCGVVDRERLSQPRAEKAARPRAGGTGDSQGDPARPSQEELAARPSRGSVDPLPSREARAANRVLSLAGIPAIIPDGTPVRDMPNAQPDHIDKTTGKYERLNRNKDGSYGPQGSSPIDVDLERFTENVLREGVSAGSAALNTWAEGWLSGYGRAKVNVTPSLDGEVTGSIDFLTAIYDSEATAVLSQFSVRTMPGKRVIGNMGIAHRLFRDQMAFGYNVFLDQDFTRGHARGGLGLELWYDWLRFAGNYYRPLSGWKDSTDYDARYVQERPAEGFDARLTGYLPFYKHLAVNAAMEKWFGEMVAPFGQHDRLASNPEVWVMGMSWTPVPLFSLNGETRTAKTHTEVRLGLSLNYYFGVPMADQLSPAAVTELRSIDGSRHDFVNRQNEMILEYRAKPGTYIVRAVNMGNNMFKIVITDYFGKPAVGVKVKFRT